MRLSILIYCSILIAFMAGCTGAKTASEQPSRHLSALPASFSGEIPCADCPGILFKLNLFEDGSYFQSMTYLERSAVFFEIGRWRLDVDTGIVELHGDGDRPTYLGIEDDGAVQLLDIEGQPIESEMNYTLERTEPFDWVEPQLVMSGMYRYMADAALFTECRTGTTFPVAMEADNIALEQGYLDVQKEPGELVHVTLEGVIALRMPMEGESLVPTLVPVRFISADPETNCESRREDEAQLLEGVRWQLVSIRGIDAKPGLNDQTPFLMLDSAEKRASGTTGCNVFGGGYSLEGKSISFSQMISTRMFCDGVMDQEAALLKTLEETVAWDISGGRLELLSESGAVLAVFEISSELSSP